MADVEEPSDSETLLSRAELVSKLTHEIRGPVSTVRGLVGTTLAHYAALSDEERREFLRLIRREAERLERAVEQVALALRLDAGSLRFEIHPQDLGVVVRNAVEAVEIADHALEVEVADRIEAPVDGFHIAFVVRELIGNAVTFSPPGSPISVRLRQEGDDALIEVTDHGPGIPRDKREAVFEPFADWRPPGYEDRPGTGLGLFIIRAIAHGHGGDASISDGPAGGTMLTVRLPVEG
ncbi:MAG: ATP-binding protein [Actinomycetota bacterium]|nr:ATP-binding protein [Actinomycetota bacterium]